MQVDVLEDIHILLLLVWGKMRWKDDDLHAVWDSWLLLELEWRRELTVFGLSAQGL